MTRIASFHNYQSVGNDIMRQQVKLQKNHDQLASGKRVRTAGDDPVASIYAQNLSQQSTQINQYLDTINLARSRLSNTELSLSNGEDLIDNAKRNVMKMINGSLASADRKAHRQDLQALLEDIISLANGKDESGNFLFSGTLASKQPFFRDSNNNVSYTGDSFHRTAQIAPVVEVQTSMPGDGLFMQIPNPFGD
ncbi:MAG: flagellar hook-associated protein FlgL, partial [Vibrionaceae bacterium]